jgi:hypothetical protein
MMMSQSKICQINLCTIIITIMLLIYEYRTEKKVVSRIMNLVLMKFSLMSCGLEHIQFLLYFHLSVIFKIP